MEMSSGSPSGSNAYAKSTARAIAFMRSFDGLRMIAFSLNPSESLR